MLKLVMAFVAAALFASPCLAQTTATDSNAAAQTSVIDPARLTAARRVVAANGSASSLRFVVDRMLPMIMAPIAREHGLNPTQTALATRLVGDEMLGATDEFVEMIARVYANHMSTEDLNTLADFYESEAGRRYITAMPEILRESSNMSQVFAEQVLAPRLEARVRDLQAQGRLNP